MTYGADAPNELKTNIYGSIPIEGFGFNSFWFVCSRGVVP